MKLIRALHKSEIRAAIISPPDHGWNIVIVEWGPHQYTREIHQYSEITGELMFQTINYQRVNEQELRLSLGDITYFSEGWMPYATPTPQDIQGQRRTIKKYAPPTSKKFRRAISLSEWENILRDVYG